MPVIDVEGTVPSSRVVRSSSSRCFTHVWGDIGCVVALSLELNSVDLGFEDSRPLLLAVVSSKVHLRSAISFVRLLAVIHRRRVYLVVQLLNIWTCFVDVRCRVSVVIWLDVRSYLLSYRHVRFADSGRVVCKLDGGSGTPKKRRSDGVPNQQSVMDYQPVSGQ